MTYKIIEKLLTPNKYSRPQNRLIGVRGVVVHWVANPNSSAEANRNFFENRKFGKTGYGSAHYIIGLNGDVIRCIPENEMAYHVGSETYTKEALSKLSTYPNNCTIGIECCHVDWNGKMTDATYNTLVELATDLLKKYKLTADDLWLHKEVVGWKDCHKWFVDHPDEWKKFKELVREKLNPKKVVIEQKVDSAFDTKDKLMFKGIEFKKGQIGVLTILKPINLWKRNDDKLEMIRILQPNEKYRVYGYDDKFGGQYNVGGNCWVTKMDGYVLYETPSKDFLKKAEEMLK